MYSRRATSLAARAIFHIITVNIILIIPTCDITVDDYYIAV